LLLLLVVIQLSISTLYIGLIIAINHIGLISSELYRDIASITYSTRDILGLDQSSFGAVNKNAVLY
jgi:hypothetical protein